MISIPSRQVHLDFHTSEHIPGVGAGFSRANFQDALKLGRVNSITVFAKCHHSWSYYPTRVGMRHPTLERDLLGEWIEASHEVGVRAPVYYTVGWSATDAELHPEWVARHRDGSPAAKNFDPAANSLVPVAMAVWENWVFVRISPEGPSLEEFLGAEVITEVAKLGLANLKWFDRKHYIFDCNWKVFVDNYLDGGYHVPYLHEGLGSVLDYNKYTIENGRRHCLQSSPMVTRGAEAETGAVRKGERAYYYWFYPNFMFNWYEGVMDTNLVYPRGVHQTEVIFDFWFADVSDEARAFNRASIDIANRVQDEDEGICKSVQRGLRSRAYDTGRLSVRREAGEQLFHQLLYADLRTGALRG